MPKDITPRKIAGPLTEVVFCYMSDRQERFGLLLFCDANMKRGHLLFTESENILLIVFLLV